MSIASAEKAQIDLERRRDMKPIGDNASIISRQAFIEINLYYAIAFAFDAGRDYHVNRVAGRRR